MAVVDVEVRSQKRLAIWKEAIPIMGVVVAVLYGIGWVLQYQSITRLGVGPLGVSREAAVATSFALIVSMVPGVVFIAYLLLAYMEGKSRNWKYWAGSMFMGTIFFAISALLVAFLPLQVGKAPPDLRNAAIVTLTMEWLLTLMGVSILAINLSDKTPKELDLSMLKILLSAVLLLAVFAQIFASTLLPVLPETFGGYGRSKVLIRLKDPDELMAGSIIAHDDKAMVLGNAALGPLAGPFGTNRIPVLRIPVDRITEIRPYQGSSQ